MDGVWKAAAARRKSAVCELTSVGRRQSPAQPQASTWPRTGVTTDCGRVCCQARGQALRDARVGMCWSAVANTPSPFPSQRNDMLPRTMPLRTALHGARRDSSVNTELSAGGGIRALRLQSTRNRVAARCQGVMTGRSVSSWSAENVPETNSAPVTSNPVQAVSLVWPRGLAPGLGCNLQETPT